MVAFTLPQPSVDCDVTLKCALQSMQTVIYGTRALTWLPLSFIQAPDGYHIRCHNTDPETVRHVLAAVVVLFDHMAEPLKGTVALEIHDKRFVINDIRRAFKKYTTALDAVYGR